MVTAIDTYTAHVDQFARSRLPPRALWPEFLFDLPELQYPDRCNCGVVLLDDAVAEGHGSHPAMLGSDVRWTYSQLLEKANRIANVLVHDLRVVPGNRVLLRGPNTPMLAACWLAVMKAGAIAVTTMPLLRATELDVIIQRAQVQYALCDARNADELRLVPDASSRFRLVTFGSAELEDLMARRPASFTNADTAAEDVCMLAFTSGTSGLPKATLQFHRDVLAMVDVVGRGLLRLGADDICIGTPPLAFTFGLGALLAFPLGCRGSTVLLEDMKPESLLAAIQTHRVTSLFTAPTAYRKLLTSLKGYDLSSLRRCISAGESLPKAVSDAWHAATGLRLIDGIGATEMMHIFISAVGDQIRPGSTGQGLPGYRVCVLDEQDQPLPKGSIGQLAVKGPTGCRYMDDEERQRRYVRNGWNVTGDVYLLDEAGYFWFQGRADDMIVSGGYNIGPSEVESALLNHPAVRECAVVGAPDEARGEIVKAYVVVEEGHHPDAALVKELQDFVKRTAAPYKYPRAVEFLATLPKTPTGKLQRHVLRTQARRQSG